jgi:gluconolactonase
MEVTSGSGLARRRFLAGALASTAGAASAQAFDFKPEQRYPDPSVQQLDPEFAKYKLFNSSLEQIATGFRWVEGPLWVADGRYLLFSDIPNNRILRWDETTGQIGEFRRPSNYSNGLGRDRQGRLLACEHYSRRVSRTEYDGSITVLADRYQGKRLNSPNDIVATRDGSLWFTDPAFGIGGHWEGEKAEAELPTSIYRIDAVSGALQAVVTDLAGPNGLTFSPDEKTLYVVESLHQPQCVIWAYDVAAGGRLSNKRLHITAKRGAAFDGIKCDEYGNLWCAQGSDGSVGANAAEFDGVVVYNPAGKAIGQIRLPERCANLCFGGAKNNRLFMASCHSIYALYVGVRGAV